MTNKKIVCLGAGSSYFQRALGDFAINECLSGSEVTLYDIDLEKAELMASFGRRLAQQSGTGLRIRACAELSDAVDGADFAISSVGGSGISLDNVYGSANHNADLMIPARYGIYQLLGDTCGPAGMMMGLRSIPVYLSFCDEMAKRCPNVVILNHSNPMSVLCRAMIKYSPIQRVIGICHGVQAGIMHIAHLLAVEPEELEVVWIGTNHYHWFTRILHRGRDVYQEVRAKMAARQPPQGEIMSVKLSQAYGNQIVYQEDGHILEFYPFLAQARDPASLPYGYGEEAKAHYADLRPEMESTLSASEQIMIRQEQLKKLGDELDKIGLPEPSPSVVRSEGIASLIESIATGRREVRIVNIPNKGAVPNLPDYAILELEGVTDSYGVRGIQTGKAPLSLMGILQKRIAWQELVVEAGVKGDRNLALQALLLDEMAILPEKAEAMLDELLFASKELLPQFNSSLARSSNLVFSSKTAP